MGYTEEDPEWKVFEPNPRQQGLKPDNRIALNGGWNQVFEPNPRQQGLKPTYNQFPQGSYAMSLNPIHDNKD